MIDKNNIFGITRFKRQGVIIKIIVEIINTPRFAQGD